MAPTTALSYFDLPFQLYTDASTLFLVAILAKVQVGRERIICCTLRALSQTKLSSHQARVYGHCLATAKLCPYLMVNKFDLYTDHYTLQWLKSMRTGLALLYLYLWSMALEEFDFTVHHRPGKAQSHVGGLNQLPVEQAPAEGEVHSCNPAAG